MDDDLVQIDMVFDDETWEISPPITRWQARIALRLFGEQGTLWKGVKRVRQAVIVDYTPTLEDIRIPGPIQ